MQKIVNEIVHMKRFKYLMVNLGHILYCTIRVVRDKLNILIIICACVLCCV